MTEDKALAIILDQADRSIALRNYNRMEQMLEAFKANLNVLLRAHSTETSEGRKGKFAMAIKTQECLVGMAQRRVDRSRELYLKHCSEVGMLDKYAHEQRSWLETFIEEAINRNLCMQISCTTCGAGEFRRGLKKASQDNGEKNEHEHSELIILEELSKLPQKEDSRWVVPLRLIIFQLDRTLHSRSLLLEKLGNSWAGDILQSMIDHYDERRRAQEEHTRYCSPEAAAHRRVVKKAQRQQRHEERCASRRKKMI